MHTTKLFKISAISFFTASLLFTGCGGGGSDTTTETTFSIPETTTVQENGTTVVLKLPATQSTDYTYKLTGEDKDYFTIDNDYNLKFLETPDYETKNEYHITVELYEGDMQKDAKNLTITVTDDPSDNDTSDATAPVFDTAANIQIPENKLEITTIQAHDESGTVTYAITGGDDKDRFLIDETTGKLTFNHFTADYEHPSDKDANNEYLVEITATDSALNKTAQTFTITVTDVSDTGTAANAKVLKTGLNDGPNNAPGFGDPRTVEKNGEVVSVGNNGLYWEDTAHINETVTFDEAATYCANLTLGGRNWRVPTRKELFELVNYGKYTDASPIMYDDGITYNNNGFFWTRTTLFEGRTYKGDNFEVSDKAWFLSFRFGDDDIIDKSEKIHVRCVSGATTFSSSGSFVSKGDYVKDQVTGLEWENNSTAISQHLTWYEAKERCESLPGGTWRLPNINELHTIMPENDMVVLLYAQIGADISIGPFWSSSSVPYDTDANKAFYIENREYNAKDDGCTADVCPYGDTQHNAVGRKDLPGSIRSICVRGGRL